MEEKIVLKEFSQVYTGYISLDRWGITAEITKISREDYLINKEIIDNFEREALSDIKRHEIEKPILHRGYGFAGSICLKHFGKKLFQRGVDYDKLNINKAIDWLTEKLNVIEIGNLGKVILPKYKKL